MPYTRLLGFRRIGLGQASRKLLHQPNVILRAFYLSILLIEMLSSSAYLFIFHEFVELFRSVILLAKHRMESIMATGAQSYTVFDYVARIGVIRPIL